MSFWVLQTGETWGGGLLINLGKFLIDICVKDLLMVCSELVNSKNTPKTLSRLNPEGVFFHFSLQDLMKKNKENVVKRRRNDGVH